MIKNISIIKCRNKKSTKSANKKEFSSFFLPKETIEEKKENACTSKDNVKEWDKHEYRDT